MSDDAMIAAGNVGNTLGRHVSSHRLRPGLHRSQIKISACLIVGSIGILLIPQSDVPRELQGFLALLPILAAFHATWLNFQVLKGHRRFEVFEGGFVRVGLFRSRAVPWSEIAATRWTTESSFVGDLRALDIRLNPKGRLSVAESLIDFDDLASAIEGRGAPRTDGQLPQRSRTRVEGRLVDDGTIAVGFRGGALGRHVSTHRASLPEHLGAVIFTAALAAFWIWAIANSGYVSHPVAVTLIATGIVLALIVVRVAAWHRRVELFEGGLVIVGAWYSRPIPWGEVAEMRRGQEGNPLGVLDPTKYLKTRRGREIEIPIDLQRHDDLIRAIEAGLAQSRRAADS